MSNQKTCTSCGSTKDLAEFRKSKCGKYGVGSKCKLCEKQYAKDHYEKNKESIRERNAKWQANNKHKSVEYTRKYRFENLGKSLESGKRSVAKWRSKNPESARIAGVEYRNRNKDKMSALWLKRKSHVKQATPPWANHFFIEQAYNIAKARERMLGGAWHVDHIIPLRGENVCGLHVETNLQVVSSEYNLRKGNKFIEGVPS